ncbi:MAG: hypothetical protein KJ739_04005 [Nitrospinae bacterium]|nr:hypothetical protein [Nitrospinota bacterium]MCG2813353.1 hypothetical protein [Thermodesulfovibrionales bacterium]
MNQVTKVMVVLFLTVLVGCAGKFEYTRPTSPPTLNNSVVITKSKDELWKIIVPMLGKQFFVINNLDKDSGIINISYSGDPEKYVDCGWINSYVKNARGERTYSFPASKAYQEYEVMDLEHGGGLLFFNRKMSLEGRMNIIVEEMDGTKSRVTANTKYILTKTTTVRDVQNRSNTLTDTISFNSGQESTFAGRAATTCRSTSKLEDEVLTLLTGH